MNEGQRNTSVASLWLFPFNRACNESRTFASAAGSAAWYSGTPVIPARLGHGGLSVQSPTPTSALRDGCLYSVPTDRDTFPAGP